ncbi:pentapeptide repeat-containing protein [Spirillospora sp. NPDC050679]
MTLHESPRSFPLTTTWPRCTAVHGCEGRAADPFPACPAHLGPGELAAFAAGLRPGADLDLRGVTVGPALLETLLDALTGPDGRPHLGRGRFDEALLPARTSWRGACFEGDGSFDGACFTEGVSFFDVRFLGHASFRGARFLGNASFHEARFQRHASFDEAVFAGDALFGETAWGADASFARTVFMGAAAFDQARFGRDAAMPGACFGGATSFRRVRLVRHARFERARFRQDVWLGPLEAGGAVSLSNATAHGGLRVQATAARVVLENTTVHGDGDLRLARAELSLENATFAGKVTVRPFKGAPPVPTSLRGTAAARLDLVGLDLSECRFLGLAAPLSLDRCAFAPRLADELSGADGVALGALYDRLAGATSDADLARTLRYRALEARRHGHPARVHRWALVLLWLTCGYGLRAGRAVVWAAVIAAIVFGVAVVHHGQHRASRHALTRHAQPRRPGPAVQPGQNAAWRPQDRARAREAVPGAA